MRIFHSHKDTLYEACDFADERERAYSLHASLNAPVSSMPLHQSFPVVYGGIEVYRITRFFLRRHLFRRLLEAYEQATQLEGHILLKVHGGFTGSTWWFKDGGRYSLMQHWIDKMDGKASALFLYACNGASATIKTRKSLVFHANDKFNLQKLQRGRVSVRLYVPGEGYVEEDRKRLKNIIEDLEAKVAHSVLGDV